MTELNRISFKKRKLFNIFSGFLFGFVLWGFFVALVWFGFVCVLFGFYLFVGVFVLVFVWVWFFFWLVGLFLLETFYVRGIVQEKCSRFTVFHITFPYRILQIWRLPAAVINLGKTLIPSSILPE